MVIDEHLRDRDFGRPWWFLPALGGIVAGAVIGVFVLPEPLPPCAPPDVKSEVVVERFLLRLGSSAEAISECWTPGRLGPEELQTYVRASPPTRYAFGAYGAGAGRNGEHYLQWQMHLTWSDGPPEGWRSDEPRWIMLIRHERPTRWTIELTQPPLRPGN